MAIFDVSTSAPPTPSICRGSPLPITRRITVSRSAPGGGTSSARKKTPLLVPPRRIHTGTRAIGIHTLLGWQPVETSPTIVSYSIRCGPTRKGGCPTNAYFPHRMTTKDRLPWGILFPAVLAPNLFYATGRGAVIPVIPLLALHMGASNATAALIAALL